MIDDLRPASFCMNTTADPTPTGAFYVRTAPTDGADRRDGDKTKCIRNFRGGDY